MTPGHGQWPKTTVSTPRWHGQYLEQPYGVAYVTTLSLLTISRPYRPLALVFRTRATFISATQRGWLLSLPGQHYDLYTSECPTDLVTADLVSLVSARCTLTIVRIVLEYTTEDETRKILRPTSGLAGTIKTRWANEP